MGEGTIIKALCGFYTVADGSRRITCKAKGRFRHVSTSPLVGDHVTYSLQPDATGTIDAIAPRKNSFIRPAVANIDAMVYIAGAAKPVTDPFLIDRFSVIARHADCEMIVCLNKCDLVSADELFAIYSRSGFPTVCTSAATGEGIETLRSMIQGKICAFAGNSGIGKSSILNCLVPDLALKTDEISEKLGRGKHTTRHVEFFPLDDTTFVADTPGFASFEVQMVDDIEAEQLQFCFPDFEPYFGSCRFQDCRHLNEPDCAISSAVRTGALAPTRYESYKRLYDLIKTQSRNNY